MLESSIPDFLAHRVNALSLNIRTPDLLVCLAIYMG